nr:hypothetical protein [Tanacetum cinerariifolium]
MTLKLDNDRNLRQGARVDVQPETSKMFRHGECGGGGAWTGRSGGDVVMVSVVFLGGDEGSGVGGHGGGDEGGEVAAVV